MVFGCYLYSDQLYDCGICCTWQEDGGLRAFANQVTPRLNYIRRTCVVFNNMSSFICRTLFAFRSGSYDMIIALPKVHLVAYDKYTNTMVLSMEGQEMLQLKEVKPDTFTTFVNRLARVNECKTTYGDACNVSCPP